MSLSALWLHDCLTTHHECLLPINETPPMPTRIIDVGGHHQQPRLIISHGKREPYCTLSYCWGQAPPCSTLKSNFEERLNGFRLESLPRTLSEAIVVARSLGLSYIWIDSVCIIQDDPSDWAAESKVTFGIENGRSSNLFVGAVPMRENDDYDHRKLEATDVRGWTLQEQLLSQRLLHFSAEQVLWECTTCRASESDPVGERNKHRFGKDVPSQLIPLDLRELMTQHDQGFQVVDCHERTQRQWQSLVENYMARKLTKESDRLMAVIGIASRLEPLLDTSFVLGVWSSTQFWPSLLWRLKPRTDELPGPPNTSFPSWSWASARTRVVFSWKSQSSDNIWLQVQPETSFLSELICIDAENDLSSVPLTGKVMMKGKLRRLFHYPLTDLDFCQSENLSGRTRRYQTRITPWQSEKHRLDTPSGCAEQDSKGSEDV